jgi:Domain of unknown function (DUF1839)
MNALTIGASPETYVPHGLHRGDRDWAESNCYVDLWIEVLHGLGFEPLAGLGFTLRTDLEADQWTFFKFPHDELFSLFGIEVIELNPWQSVLAQTVNEVHRGRIPLVEVDAFHLPDTAGTTYRSTHGKTSIGITSIDTEACHLTYFHNAGHFVADGCDFRGLFPTPEESPNLLPPYIEVAKPSVGAALVADDLREEAVRLLRRTLRRIPSDNPFERYARVFPSDIERLREANGVEYHSYAFANFRQFGAAFSLAAEHLRWLSAVGFSPSDDSAFTRAIDSFARISSTAKALQFQSARSAIAGKAIDASSRLQDLATCWEEGMTSLRSVFG